MISGMKTFFYPTPLHYSVIPEIAYEIHARALDVWHQYFCFAGLR